VPTGALFESGSNSDGSWVRFADGTQICRLTTTLNFNASSRLLRDWTYPVPFASGSDVSVNRRLSSRPRPTLRISPFSALGTACRVAMSAVLCGSIAAPAEPISSRAIR